MPFATERIWQSIPHSGESIMVESFPESDPARIDPHTEGEIKVLFDVISEIRKIRSELKINPASRVKISLLASKDKSRAMLEKNNEYICSLAKAGELEFKDFTGKKGYIKAAAANIDIFINIADAIDVESEKKRIGDQIKKVNLDIEKSKKKLSKTDFLNQAPKEVIQKEKNNLFKICQTS